MAVAHLAITVPTYQGRTQAHAEGQVKEWDEPRVPVLVCEAEGVRIVLGSHDYTANKPDIAIERRPNGWCVFIHPEYGNDAAGYVYMLDDGRTFFQHETGNAERTVILGHRDPIPTEVDAGATTDG